jgi:hypothetical protein
MILLTNKLQLKDIKNSFKAVLRDFIEEKAGFLILWRKMHGWGMYTK